MAVQSPIPNAPERVLSTMNVDGSRRWPRPRPSHGAWWQRRRIVGWLLMAIFLVLPWVRMNGRPALLLDLPKREFLLFGARFLATDTVLFMLLMISTLIGIFLITALLGRVWCGWGCPQTVYMEFLFRPLEYLIEGGPRGVEELDKHGRFAPRRLLKYAVFVALACVLAHTFLSYFVGTDQLAIWMRRSPIEHPTSFLIMLGTTLAVFIDFAWFREQTCLVACPYGRLQSVLLDRRSLIVGYDAVRGEPRMKGNNRALPVIAGDCIDCRMCVQTCPTGIDIRDGLQMECLHCTQCMDACDKVMAKIHRPEGLIRYGSRDMLERRPGSWLRPRIIVYPLVLLVTGGLFLGVLLSRRDLDVTLLRGKGTPYVLQDDGTLLHQVRIKLVNRADHPREVKLALAGADDSRLVVPMNPYPLKPDEMATLSVFVVTPRHGFHLGRRAIAFELSDGKGWHERAEWELLGPGSTPGEHEED
ncbi:MAG: cytochrome c oxidase accessory protein CcoG [Gemmatimonadetes bacterium]|nr:cytochrome c oxidase accessory protein CcoG [Gemmatimonadota bacterium]